MDRANVIASGADPSTQGWDAGQIKRTRLLERLRGTRGLVLIDAPSGFGKSVLAQQLEADPAWQRPTLLVRPDGETLAKTLNSQAYPDLLIIDTPTRSALDEIAAINEGSIELVVCMGPHLETTAELRRLRPTRLGHIDLRFDLQETHRLLSGAVGDATSDQVAYLLHSVTDGWPEHIDRVVQAMAGRGSSMDSVRSLASRGTHLDPLIDRCLDALDESMTEAMTQMAHLGRFSERAADAMVPDLVGRAVEAGFPLLENNFGELIIPELIASRLSDLALPNQEVATRLVPVLVGTLGLHSTIRALLSFGAPATAAELICSLPEHHLDPSNQTELIGMLRAIEPHTSDLPALAFRRARVHRNLAQLADQNAALELALASARAAGNSKVEHAAEVELFAIEIQTSETEGPFAERLADLKAATPSDADRPTLIRLREAEAFMLCLDGDPSDLHRSLEVFREVAAEWEMLGDRTQSASVLRRMVGGPMMHLGRFSEGANVLAQIEGVPDSPFGLAATGQVRARFLALSGRALELERVLSHARGLTQAVGVSWMFAYLHWNRALRGALIGDLSEAEDGYLEARNFLGELLNTPTRNIFFGECASAFACLGASDLAIDALSQCTESDDITGKLEHQTAVVVVNARVADADVAEKAASELLADPTFPPDRAWRIQVERLIAANRRGKDLANEDRIREQIESSAVRLGLADHARALLGPLEDSAIQVPAPLQQDQNAPVALTLLGGFSISSQGQQVDIPSGNVSHLLKLLAVADEPRSVDFVIDRLWPEASTDVGRRRLKNVLTRVRKVSEAPLLERTATTLALSPNVTTDLYAFRAAAQKASSAQSPTCTLPLCVDALSLYSGPLLPTDMYDDEIAVERADLERSAETLLELLLESVEPGRVSAAWVFDTAVRLGVESDQIFVRVAEFAADSGAEVCAAHALNKASGLAEALDVPLLFDERLRHLLPAGRR